MKETPRKRNDLESDWEIHNPFKRFHFFKYFSDEISQSVRKKKLSEVPDFEEKNVPFRNRVYTFMVIPRYLESFMLYGWLQCFDHMLLLYTFLPLRCFLAVCALLIQKIHTMSVKGLDLFHVPRSLRCFNTDHLTAFSKLFWQAQEMKDLVKFSLICFCSLIVGSCDWSVVYHEIRTQSIMKLYIFFNVLELTDKLLSSVCQDALDDLLLTISLGASSLQSWNSKLRQSPSPKENFSAGDETSSHKFPSFTIQEPSNDINQDGSRVLFKDFVLQYIFAFLCILAHCFLLFCQVITLNVAFNTKHYSLLTVMFSNNFVELKGSVFRKMGKTNLFQITCADVRERFHYSIWVIIVVCRNISANGWNNADRDYLSEMIFSALCLILSELVVDWIKHAFIIKFNVIPADVYNEYKVSIAYDLLLCRQGKHSGDYSEVLSRRMGLTPIPLSCLVNVMILNHLTLNWFTLFAIPVIILLFFIVKIGSNLLLLSAAFKVVKAYIVQKQDEYNQNQQNRLKQECIVINTNSHPDFNAKHSTSPISFRRNRLQPEIYTGFDQPTADEGQFHTTMPVNRRHSVAASFIPTRRSHSDSFCAISQFELENIGREFYEESASNTNSTTPPPRISRSNLKCVTPVLEYFDSSLIQAKKYYKLLSICVTYAFILVNICTLISTEKRIDGASKNQEGSPNVEISFNKRSKSLEVGELDKIRIRQEIEAEDQELAKQLQSDFEKEEKNGSEFYNVGTSSKEIKDPDSIVRKRKNIIQRDQSPKEDYDDSVLNEDFGDDDDKLIGPNSIVKQPLSNVDRYSMLGGQIL